MSEPIREISPEELSSRLSNNEDIELIDVRELHEHQKFNIGGKLIPFGEIMEEGSSIATNKDVVFYCKMGIRSMIAIQRLQQKFGYTNLINLRGGIEAWKRAVSS